MATTITITVDTETKEISASVNGQAVDNVDYVSIYKYTERSYDEPDEKHIGVSIESSEQGESKEKIVKSWRIMANKTEEIPICKSVKDDFLSCLPSK